MVDMIERKFGVTAGGTMACGQAQGSKPKDTRLKPVHKHWYL